MCQSVCECAGVSECVSGHFPTGSCSLLSHKALLQEAGGQHPRWVSLAFHMWQVCSLHHCFLSQHILKEPFTVKLKEN